MSNLATVTTYELNIWSSNEKLAEIKRMYGNELSALEWEHFVALGRATGLNPFLREIWAVKYKRKDGPAVAQIFIGRDGYRRNAQRHPLYEYHYADAVYSNDSFAVTDGEVSHKYDLTNRGRLVGAYCVTKRRGSARPTFVFVDVNEYNKEQSVWKEKPATMIKKVAEAQCLRGAFQELFAGTYDESEEWLVYQTAVATGSPKRGIAAVKEKLGISHKEEEEVIEFDEQISHNEEGNPIFTYEQIAYMMQAAKDIKELKECGALCKDFPEKEKLTLKELYKECRANIMQSTRSNTDEL